jgi:hypothetical protein
MTIPSQLNPGPPRSQTPDPSQPSPNVSNQKRKRAPEPPAKRQRQGKTKKQKKKGTQNLSNEEHGKQNDDHDRAWLATDIQKMIEAACAKRVKGTLAARAHSAASPQVITAPGLSLQHESHDGRAFHVFLPMTDFHPPLLFPLRLSSLVSNIVPCCRTCWTSPGPAAQILEARMS